MKKYLPPLIFAAWACFLLLAFYSDMLQTAQLRTPFMYGGLFRDELLAAPFGLLSYAGCWLTQHFYYPVVGVGLLLTIWMASWTAGVRALHLKDGWTALMMLPMGCLLLSLTDMGYWIYCLKLHGYWFSQSLGYLCCLLLLWAMGTMKSTMSNRIIQALFCLALYPVLGWYVYLLSACLLLQQRNWFCLSVIFAPALWQQTVYTGQSMYAMWVAGFPVFDNNAIVMLRPMLPFVVLTVVTLLLAAVPLRYLLSRRQWSIGLACLSVLIAGLVWMGSFKDYNYLAEMRMTKHAMNDDWQGVLDEAKQAPRPSRTMVALKNIALMNVGQLGNRSFALSNDGRDITNPDTLQVNIMQIASPVVYYQYGMVNFASRWCIENGVAYGYSPFYLQTLVRCAQASGETALMQRYLRLLHGMTYYSNWQPKPVTRIVQDLRTAFVDVIDADNNSCERYLIDIFSRAFGSDDVLVQELNLFYAMLYGDPARFWPAMVTYVAAHPHEPLPQHYQEAHALFQDHYPAELPFGINVPQIAVDGYQAFRQHYAACKNAGADKNTIAEAMRQQWGKTFWWHYYFGRNNY